jgi:membrane protease YdiL (CAAX protease family)
LIGGVLLVASIQSLNALLGCVSFSWPSGIPSSSLDAMTWLKMYVQMIILAGRGIITATGIVLVEELLFRSWLPEEIEADVGYHQAIIISGLAFSLFQRYIIYYHLENIKVPFPSGILSPYSSLLALPP